jgi:cysteine desulfurase/selenocysteine lyase
MSLLLETKSKHSRGIGLDVDRIRREFPLLNLTFQGRPIIYLDNGATTQKPRVVIEAIRRFYEEENANIHRGAYALSREATGLYEHARERVAEFIGAADPSECIFTRGTTESINLVAHSWGRAFLRPGDEIILSHLEHHSNIVPWQIVAEATGAVIRVVPIDDAGDLRLEEYARLLNRRTKLVAITHVSNALGTVNDIESLAALAHAVGAVFLADGAQWVAHHPTNVRELGVDFYCFSGHKLFGPTGCGVLWGRRALLEQMPPWQGGGDMIERVTFEKTSYAPLPNKFEAGTPHIAGAVGLRAAIDFLHGVGFPAVEQHEAALLAYARQRLLEVPGLRLIGSPRRQSCVLSFVFDHPVIAPLDIGTALDLDGIAIRTGHHCCQPLMDRLGITGTARLSLSLYNTFDEIDAAAEALRRLQARKIAEIPRCADRIELGQRPEPRYPEPAGPSPSAVADELVEAFDLLDDWNQRYEYIIDLGKRLLPFPEEERTEANRVHGCQSRVYICARKNPHKADVLDFLADSDADIVRGLIAILQKIFSGQRAADILAFDVQGFFRRLGIDENLALTRRNGLAEMVKRIRQFASAMVHVSALCTNADCATCAQNTLHN